MERGTQAVSLAVALTFAGAALGDITLLSRHSEAFAEFHQPFPFPPNDMPWNDFAEFNEFGDWTVVLEHGSEHRDFAGTDRIGGEFVGRLQGGNPATLYPYDAVGARQNVTFQTSAAHRISIRFNGECTPCWEQRTECPNLIFKLVNTATNEEAFNIFGDGNFTTYGSTQRLWTDQTWRGQIPAGTYELIAFGGYEETDYMAGNLYARGIFSFELVFEGDVCGADFNGDDFVDFFDYSEFVECFEGGACPSGQTADFNGDDFVDFFDYSDFVEAFETGC